MDNSKQKSKIGFSKSKETFSFSLTTSTDHKEMKRSNSKYTPMKQKVILNAAYTENARDL